MFFNGKIAVAMATERLMQTNTAFIFLVHCFKIAIRKWTWKQVPVNSGIVIL